MPAWSIVFVFICFTAAQLKLTSAFTDYGRCVTPNRERANCVALQDCGELYNLLNQPNLSPADREYLRQSQCGYYQNKVLLCCPSRYLTSTTAGNRNGPKPQPPTPSPPVVSANLLPKPPQCGNVLATRIVGGNETHIDEYPWLVLIEYTKPGNEKGHHCGGTLINDRYVITAAHCVVGAGIPADWRLSGVRLGEWDTLTNPDCEVDIRGKQDCAPPHIDVPVEERIPHPQYVSNARNQVNDIALLRLARKVTYSAFVEPICLPTETTLRSATFIDTKMDVSGWGRTETTATSNLKLKATVTGWDLQRCKKTYAQQNINLEPSQMCAGGVAGIDSCRGDSGGPLVVQETINDRDAYVLSGVVSFGPTPCGLRNWPGVYTRVGAHMDWILRTIKA